MALNQIWIGIFVGIGIVIGFKSVLGFNHNPVILILAAIGMYATGSLIRVRIVKFGAIALALAAIISFLLPVSDQYLVAGIAMVLGYLVPGYYLKLPIVSEFKPLDPLLHSQLRLAVMSLLLSVESAEFTFLKEKTESTAGNLSVQLDKLEKAKYIKITKSFKGKRP